MAAAGRDQRRRRLLYGRRKGPKLSTHQAGLFATLLPRLRLRLEPGIDPTALFDTNVADIWLEIGFGSGEHLLWQAQHYANIGIIGAEPYEAGIAKLLSRIAASSAQEENWNPVSRIRIHEGDARDVLQILPDECLGRVFILFPDPWPKKRHHKRRFIQMGTLDSLARVMAPGATLRFASDDAGYLAWALEHICAHRSFIWTATCTQDWR
ncbi:MAG TPA: tRNA (guanine(46)-N(7))-methyltransferase TrmB, partial [Rhizomicrobium sp.]|nr:tRNA (guanine(46)-N(7))-methyltransferase TrmB [Rhizomicrobium sp.]